MIKKLILLIFCLLLVIKGEFREKRHLIYVNSGVFKFIIGISIPINVEMQGGSLNWAANLQGLYRLPDNITYFDDYKIISKRSMSNTWKRHLIYSALSKSISRLGMPGEECINLIICELAQGDILVDENGLFGEILHILFSPLNDVMQTFSKYKNAQLQGMYNSSDCNTIFKNCPLSDLFFMD